MQILTVSALYFVLGVFLINKCNSGLYSIFFRKMFLQEREKSCILVRR